MTPAGEKAAARLAVRQACAAVPAGVHAAASGSLCRALAALLEEVMEGRLPNHRAELMAELDRLAGRER